MGPVLELTSGTAVELFAQPWPADRDALAVRYLQVSEAVVVLGSSQRADLLEEDASVVRRRTGGGAVFVSEALVWFDVWVPAAHERWCPDVGRAGWWVGEACVDGLAALGRDGLVTHRAAMIHHPRDRDVCWLGLGPGEVHDGLGRKVVGVAQRRTREGALFQLGVLLRPSQAALAPLMTPWLSADDVADAELACGASRGQVVAEIGERLLG